MFGTRKCCAPAAARIWMIEADVGDRRSAITSSPPGDPGRRRAACRCCSRRTRRSGTARRRKTRSPGRSRWKRHTPGTARAATPHRDRRRRDAAHPARCVVNLVEVLEACSCPADREIRAAGERGLQPAVGVVQVPELLNRGRAIRVSPAGVGRRRKDDARGGLREQPAVAAVGEAVAEDEHVADLEQLGARGERLQRERGEGGRDEHDRAWALHVCLPPASAIPSNPGGRSSVNASRGPATEMCNEIKGQASSRSRRRTAHCQISRRRFR